MWTCEQKSADWWSSSCVEICFKLLKTLSEWLSNKKCSNYFVSNCNLLSREMNEQNLNETIRRLNYFENKRMLAGWFGEKYVRLAVRLMLSKSKLNQRISSMDDFDAVYKDFLEQTTYRYFMNSFNNVVLSYIHSETACRNLLSELMKLDNSLVEYYKTFVLLRVCCEYFDKDESFLDFDYLKLLSILEEDTAQSRPTRQYPTTFKSATSSRIILPWKMNQLSENLIQATSLTEYCLNFKLLGILCFQSSNVDRLRVQSFVNLAALHYVAGKYSTSSDFCEKVLSEKSSLSEPLGLCDSRHLLYLGDVARGVGFLAIIQSTIKSQLARNTRFFNVSFRTEVLVRFLTILCDLENSKSPDVLRDKLDLLRKSIVSKDQSISCTTPLELILFATARQRVEKHRVGVDIRPSEHWEISSNLSNSTRSIEKCFPGNLQPKLTFSPNDSLLELLAKLATEHLTIFFLKITSPDYLYGPVGTIAHHYMAFYFYKQQQYEKALYLCDESMKKLPARCTCDWLVSVFHPFRYLLDDNILNLTGIMMLCNPDAFTVGKATKATGNAFMSPFFVIYYVKLQCLLSVGSAKLDILKAVRLLSRVYHSNFESALCFLLQQKIIRRKLN